MYVCMCLHVYVCTRHAGAFRGQKKVLTLLELELQVVISPLTRILGTEHGSSGIVASALNF